MKKLLFPCIVMLFLTSCAPTKNWVAESFTKQESRIPGKLAIAASLDNYELLISITNTTRELWQFDVSSSVIRLPATGWSSGLVDNHVGKPNAPLSLMLPGTSNYKLYPASMITETDDEIKDVGWLAWPINEDQIIQIALVFIDPDGESKTCTLEAEFKSLKK
jgi:hypothetical protein